METQESLPISDVLYILLLVWNIVYIVFSVSFPSIYRTYWMEIYGMFYNESNRHNGGATTYPSHCHITWFKKFMTFSILRGIYTVIQAHSFVTFLGINYDKKWASQISDDRIIVIRFMTKKYIFVVEDLLWHGIGDEPIFFTQMS